MDASFTPNGEKIWDAIIGILRPEKAVKPIKTELQNIPSDANVNKMTADLQPVLTQLTTSDHSDLELDEFIADGLKKEVIIKSKPMWHAYNGKKYAGKDKLMSALRGDPKLVSLLKKDLNR